MKNALAKITSDRTPAGCEPRSGELLLPEKPSRVKAIDSWPKWSNNFVDFKMPAGR